ncbi:DUF3515 domain-containing protein [Streptomyces stramineus]|uniref:DUF3515 domain-containing protein n=1 Tax=Streptomyces stramineus TaxID=173861 RepID=A0ABN1BGL4_9ACTN
MKSSLRRSLGLPAVVVFFAAVGCSTSDDTAGPAVPTPSGAQAAKCRALHQALPGTVDGRKRRGTDPDSDLTAAWGDGESIALRCGVPKPALLQRNPAADSVDINGIEWLPEKQPDGSVRCTTVKREAWVEVTLPARVVGGAGDISALTDLADAVRSTVPYGIIG